MTIPLLTVDIEVIVALLTTYTCAILNRTSLLVVVLLVSVILLEALVVGTDQRHPCGGLDQGAPLWPLLLLLLLVGPLLAQTLSGCSLG